MSARGRQHRLQAQFRGQVKECLLFDQIGAHAGQVTFRLVAQGLKQQVGHREVEHGITEEFEALVVIGRETAVRQRTQEKTIIGE